MKDWLKGAIISELIVIIPSTVFIVHGIFSPNISAMGKQGTILFAFIYFPIAIVLSFLIGAIIGFVCGKIIRNPKISPTSKGIKIGFWSGLILGVLLWVFWAYDDFWGVTHTPGLIITPIGILIGGIFIGWFMGWIGGKIKSRRQ